MDEEWDGLPDDAHWDDDCYSGDVLRALEELHRQAHGAGDLEACGKSPCATIRYEAIERMREHA